MHGRVLYERYSTVYVSMVTYCFNIAKILLFPFYYLLRISGIFPCSVVAPSLVQISKCTELMNRITMAIQDVHEYFSSARCEGGSSGEGLPRPEARIGARIVMQRQTTLHLWRLEMTRGYLSQLPGIYPQAVKLLRASRDIRLPWTLLDDLLKVWSLYSDKTWLRIEPS